MNNIPATPEWAKLIPEWTAKYFELARQYTERHGGFGIPGARRVFLPSPYYVKTTLTGGKGGYCDYRNQTINLNRALTTEQAERTYAHELAHFFASNMEGQHGHGDGFKRWMKALGHVPTRCHNYKNLIETMRGSWYHCPACGHEFKSCARNFTARFHRSCNRGRTNKIYIVAGRAAAVGTHLAGALIAAHAPANDIMITPAVAEVQILIASLMELKHQGLASSPAAKKLRVQLRRLNPNWRTE